MNIYVATVAAMKQITVYTKHRKEMKTEVKREKRMRTRISFYL